MDRSLIIATLAATVTGLVNSVLYLLWISNSSMGVTALIFLALVGAGVVLLTVIFFGIPVHFLLKRTKRQSLVWYLLAGSIPSILIPIDYLLGGYYSNLILNTLFFAYVGVIAAIAFWFVIKQSVPNKPFKRTKNSWLFSLRSTF